MRRRVLGARLRELRERRGHTGEEAAASVDRSASWLSRVETGRTGIRSRELSDLLDFYRLDDPAARAELEGLAQNSHAPAWWDKYRPSLIESYAVYIGLEAAASRLRIFDSVVVPGILQVEAYARVVLRDGPRSLSSRVVEDRLRARMERRSVLTSSRLRDLSVVVEEAVVRRPFGGGRIFVDQLDHLLAVGAYPNVGLQLLPFTRTLPGLIPSQFTILDFPDDTPPVVYVEGPVGGSYEGSAEQYIELFDRLQARSLSRADTAIHIQQVRREISDRREP